MADLCNEIRRRLLRIGINLSFAEYFTLEDIIAIYNVKAKKYGDNYKRRTEKDLNYIEEIFQEHQIITIGDLCPNIGKIIKPI